METKSIFASKVFWFNALTIAAMVAANFGIDVGLDETTKTEIAVGVVSAVNLVLRFLTSTSVSVTGQ